MLTDVLVPVGASRSEWRLAPVHLHLQWRRSLAQVYQIYPDVMANPAVMFGHGWVFSFSQAVINGINMAIICIFCCYLQSENFLFFWEYSFIIWEHANVNILTLSMFTFYFIPSIYVLTSNCVWYMLNSKQVLNNRLFQDFELPFINT